MKTIELFRACLLGVLLLFLVSCATTRLTSVWRDKSYQGTPQKILVIAGIKNETNRQILEQEIVNQLNSRGYNAVTGFSVLGVKESSKESVMEMTKQMGIDTVVVIKYLDKRIVKTHVPGTAQSQTVGTYGHGTYPPGYTQPQPYPYPGSQPYPHPGPQPQPFPGSHFGGGWYNEYSTYTYNPGYTVQEEYAILGTDVYEAANEHIIWSARSATGLSGGDQKVVESFVTTILDKLDEQKIFPVKK